VTRGRTPEPPWVLIVHPDPLMREALAWALRAAELPVETAGDAEEALRLARARRPDAVVLDWQLAPPHAPRLVRRLRRRWGRSLLILVLVADGYLGAPAPRQADVSYVEHPVAPESLAALVRRALAARAAG